MIAVDTHLLVYAHREESAFHARATECIVSLAEGRGAWAIPWHRCMARVADARIAAICLEYGVRELWSADRDFRRFAALNVRNPLIV